MKVALCIAMLAGFAWAEQGADEVSDRKEIERVVAALNQFRNRAEPAVAPELFGPGARAEFDRFLGPSASNKQIWSESSESVLSLEGVQILSADVAIADISDKRFGIYGASVSNPALLILKKGSGGWKISSVRLLAVVGRR